MALTFIWKKQLVWFITLLLTIVLGLTIGAVLQDILRDEDAVIGDTKTGTGANPEVKIGIPSLPFPTSAPGREVAPSGNPPGGQTAR